MRLDVYVRTFECMYVCMYVLDVSMSMYVLCLSVWCMV